MLEGEKDQMFRVAADLSPKYTGFSILHTKVAAIDKIAASTLCEHIRLQIDSIAIERAQRNARKWEAVFADMGASEKRLPSLTALHTKFLKAGDLWRISPIVDFYNYLSLLAGAPMAAYDYEQIRGEIILRFSVSGERFVPLSNPSQIEKCRNGEIVYADEEKVLCRYWNNQDTYMSRITELTSSVVFFADLLPNEAGDESAGIIEDIFCLLPAAARFSRVYIA